MSEKSPSIHNDRAGRPMGKGLCFKPSTNIVDTKESAPTSRAKDRLQLELEEAKAQLHNIRNQTLAQVEKIIDEDQETHVWHTVNAYRDMIKGEIKNLKVKE